MDVLLVDDQHVVREALAHALAAQAGVGAVVQAGSGREALRAQELHRCHVAVIELSLADRSGTELIRELKGIAELRVVVLSMYRDEFRVAEAMRAGADGYLSKQSRLADVVEALRTVVRGRTAVSPDVSAAMVRALQRRDAAARGDMVAALSDRERQVLRLLAMGCSAKEAAVRLSISVKTVETHRARLCAKVATHSVADLTRLAVRSGLVEA
ncbi:transcriptional regulator [Sorangium cellulosum]|uniref:Transcriptional regulator n=1 Tax=Sorangium cellulosum TaxID=56 RepID=A0A2L0EVM2_SORCE|nr:response regulator transcription factor [Sorangium cellulosum]AUX43315.1 transcriptional regulator [Sorangium cellulosum]